MTSANIEDEELEQGDVRYLIVYPNHENELKKRENIFAKQNSLIVYITQSYNSEADPIGNLTVKFTSNL